MSIPDTPIKNTENDRLNRGSMAKNVAKLVNDFESNESVVVGIEGEWGSGKTSFINLVKGEIDSGKAVTIDFNPWNFSSQDQLIEDFFDELFSTFETIKPKSKLSKNIQQYKRKLKKVDINPNIAGFSLFNTSITVSSLASLRKSVEKELESSNKKIMIIIDDIDRLDTAETLAVFKLVKVTANFPNCIFFLAYDRKRVVERINEATNNAGDDYLKKIIQTTFRLPPISRNQIKTMVFEHIDKVLSDLFGGTIKLNEEDQKRWNSMIFDGFPELFQNIRDLKRYASSLRLNLSVTGRHEVNIVDFVSLEAIRVFAPDFYDEIPKNRWLFTNSVYGLTFGNKTEDKRGSAYKKITDDTLEKHPQKEIIISIMKELFPLVANQGMYGNDWEEQWSGNRQVSSDSKFEAYFQLSVSPDEISEEEFGIMMDQMTKQNLFEILAVIEKISSDHKLKNFLKKVHDQFNTGYPLNPNFFLKVSHALFSTFDKLPVDTDGFLDFDGVDRQLERLVWRISEKTEGEDAKYTFLKEVLNKATVLYPRVELLRRLKREKAGGAVHLPEMAKAVDRVITEMLPDMEKVLNQDTLKNDPYGNRIIWAYKEWGKEIEIKAYLTKLAEDKKDIFIIFRWLKTRVSSSNRGIYYRINKATLNEFVDTAVIDKTVSDLDVGQLLDDEKALYDLYKTADSDEW